MIIYNEKDKLSIKIINKEKYTNKTFKILKDNSNCEDSAYIDEYKGEDVLSFKLDDGSYTITFILDENTTEEKCFIVYYNNLINEVLSFIKHYICSECRDCIEKKDNAILYEDFFNINNFIICENLLDFLTYTKCKFCEVNENIKYKKEQEYYFGKSNFSYKDFIKEIIVSLYVDLYNLSIENIRDIDLTKEDIDVIFSFQNMEKCFINTSIDLSNIFCHTNIKKYEQM